MASKRYAKFLSKRSIISLIGIDYDVLEETGNDNYLKFYLVGFLIILILLISFLSVFYAFDLMFDMWHAEILLSLFFGLTFFNIYIFLIQTFSKEVFPSSVKIRFFNLSNLSRIGFVLFIGFLIAQPVKIFFTRHQLDEDISFYKKSVLKDFSKKNETLYASDLKNLYTEKAYFSSLSPTKSVLYQLDQIQSSIYEIDEKIERDNVGAALKIGSSNFLTKRIKYANKYPKSRLIEIFVVIIFFLPILLIYSISGESKYYALKKEKDRKKVIKHYNAFKIKYQDIFKDKFEKDVVFYEHFVDPPFNTVRKAEPIFSTQDDFFKKYLGV